MKLTEEQSSFYHAHTIKNMEEIEQSEKCGCIACCSIYNASQIEEYIREMEGNKMTALCIKCGTDAVIGDASGLDINEEILKALNKIWF